MPELFHYLALVSIVTFCGVIPFILTFRHLFSSSLVEEDTESAHAR